MPASSIITAGRVQRLAGPLKDDEVVNIPQGAGLRGIAETLNREGVIGVNPWVFIAGVAALKASSDLKPGEYSRSRRTPCLRDVIATIVEGKVVQHSVTIAGGLTSEQIVARLSGNDIFTGSVRERAARGHAAAGDLQASPRGTPREQVIQRMQQAHRRVLAEIWERRAKDIPVQTPAQLVTLASIIEKETGKAGRTQPRRRGVRQPPEAADRSCSPIRRSSTGSSAARARWAVRSSAARSRSRRPTTPMSSKACRRARSPIRAASR